MEEPQMVEEHAIAKQNTAEPKKRRQSGATKKGKIGGVAMSYIVVAIAFAIGIIICSIDGGALDLQITKLFSDLGKDATNLDGSQNFWYQFGHFFDPDITDDKFWENLWFGQLFSTVVIIIAVLLVFIPAIALGIEKSKAKKEGRKVVVPASMRYYKYGWLIAFVSLVAAIGIIQLFKYFWGRPRPDELFTNFLPWYQPGVFDGGESFMSGHTAQAALVTGLALAFLGSRKKALSIIFGIGSALLVVMTGIARMLTNDHYFSDVLWGGFMTYTVMIITYFMILDIPGQERIHRYQRTYTPFNEGYKLVLDGKAKLKESTEEGFKLISGGLEKFAAAKAAAEDINKYHREFDGFIARIDDLSSRFGTLMNEYQSIQGKKENLDAYWLKWSYVC